ncbi:MAG TPA: HEAT repeat domain-containing protein [Polyangia bacterium]
MRQVRALLAFGIVSVLLVGAAGCGGGNRRLRVGVDPVFLMQSLQSPDRDERRKAAELLGFSRDPRGTAPLIEALQKEHWTNVMAAQLNALATIGAPEAYPVIQQYMMHANQKVARIGARALRLYEQFKPYYGQALPMKKGRPVLPGAVAPAAAPAAEPEPAPEAAPEAGEQVGP